MSNELNIYIKNRINNLINTFNSNVARLNNGLDINIQNIKKSRTFNSVQKQQKISILINQYNEIYKALSRKLNDDISKIQNFKPKPIVINNRNNKKALLVGINYVGTSNELYGCINDTKCIQERISKNGFNNITILTDNTTIKPNKRSILNSFTNLLINSQAGDLLFFAYSGHGSYDIDKSGDEMSGYDQLIVPLDLNMIYDDELKEIIQKNLKPDVTLFAMFDSCFSGSVLDLKYQYMDSLNYDNYTENDKQLETKGNVFMISGCSDYQTSADAIINNKASGAMTWSLLEALKQNPTCSWRELLKTMRNLIKESKYDQIPQFSTGKFENIDTNVFI
jgi:hypothetical protein